MSMSISSHGNQPDQPDAFADPPRPSRRAIIRLAAGAAVAGVVGVTASVAGATPAFASACTNACANFITGCLNYCTNNGWGRPPNACTDGCNRLYGECLTCCKDGGTPEDCVQPGPPNSYQDPRRINTLFLTYEHIVFGRTGLALLKFQADGNLVVYDEFGKARWSSRTVHRGAYTLFQPDGNLVVYAIDHTSQPAVWASNTCCRIGAYLSVQDDGNVVIYDSGNHALWSTRSGH
jgi:hypothetical protein